MNFFIAHYIANEALSKIPVIFYYLLLNLLYKSKPGAYLKEVVPCPLPPLLTLPVVKEQNYWCQVTVIRLTFLMVSVACGQEGRMKGRILSPAVFKKVFDVYNFSYLILNLFDSDKFYALSRHNPKCANKMHHMWRSTKNQGQKI